jgi:hypothetical protein
MISRDLTRTPAAVGPSPPDLAVPDAGAAQIIEELNEILSKSHRRSPLRRALHSIGGAFAKLLSRAVPETPPQSDPPPEIRFPFF